MLCVNCEVGKVQKGRFFRRADARQAPVERTRAGIVVTALVHSGVQHKALHMSRTLEIKGDTLFVFDEASILFSCCPRPYTFAAVYMLADVKGHSQSMTGWQHGEANRAGRQLLGRTDHKSAVALHVTNPGPRPGLRYRKLCEPGHCIGVA